MMKYLSFLLLLFFSSAGLAADFSSFVCPNTYRGVRVGDSMDAVTSACGKPTTVATEQKQTNTPVTTTVWVYTQGGALGSLNVKGVSLSLPTLTIAFDSNQKVSSISSQGSSSNNSSLGYCGMGKTVNIGDSQETVKAECGEPTMVNSQESSSTTTQNVVVWTYNYGPYKPQIIFKFENGLLSGLSSGALGH
jgi:hypothetical protein